MEIAEQCLVNSNVSKAQQINQKHCLDLVPNLFLKHRVRMNVKELLSICLCLQRLDYEVNYFNDGLVKKFTLIQESNLNLN